MTRRLAVLAAFALATASALAAQQQTVFRGGVDFVQVNVNVTSGKRPVTDLTASDFAITDNGVLQTITDVGRETMPIDLSIVLDASPTGGPLVGSSISSQSLAKAVNGILDRLRPDDRVSLTTFTQRVQERLHLAPPAALSTIKPFQYQNGPMLLAPPETALYDALVLSLPLTPIPDRRQLAILFSAGPDEASFADEAAALDVARRSSAAVFVIGTTVDPVPAPAGSFNEKPTTPATEGPTRVTGAPAPSRPYTDPFFGSRPLPKRFLKTLADDTGGELQVVEPAVFLANSPTHIQARMIDTRDVSDTFVSVLENFRSSYVLRYSAKGVAHGGWHDLTVKVTRRGSYDVRARRGYAGG